MQRMINENQLVNSDYHLRDLSSMFSPADDCIDTLALLASNEYSVIKHYEVLLPHLKNEPEFCRDLQMVTRAMEHVSNVSQALDSEHILPVQLDLFSTMKVISDSGQSRTVRAVAIHRQEKQVRNFQSFFMCYQSHIYR